MFNEEMIDEVTTSIKVLDALYMSELDFDECIKVLNSLVNSFKIGKLIGMEFDKEDFKRLKAELQNTIEESKKADETITDFHN